MNINGKDDFRLVSQNQNKENQNKITIKSLFKNYKGTDYKPQEYNYGEKTGREFW